MNEKYTAIFFALDGQFVTEGEFDSIEEAWDYINNSGSRWFFYPYPYIKELNGNKIVDSCDWYNFTGNTVEDTKITIKDIHR
jgi:hypothetical protein